MGGIAKLDTCKIGGSQKYRDRIPTDFVVPPPCRYLGYVPKLRSQDSVCIGMHVRLLHQWQVIANTHSRYN